MGQILQPQPTLQHPANDFRGKTPSSQPVIQHRIIGFRGLRRSASLADYTGLRRHSSILTSATRRSASLRLPSAVTTTTYDSTSAGDTYLVQHRVIGYRGEMVTKPHGLRRSASLRLPSAVMTWSCDSTTAEDTHPVQHLVIGYRGEMVSKPGAGADECPEDDDPYYSSLEPPARDSEYGFIGRRIPLAVATQRNNEICLQNHNIGYSSANGIRDLNRQDNNGTKCQSPSRVARINAAVLCCWCPKRKGVFKPWRAPQNQGL